MSVTLKGEAPFNVYARDQLPIDHVRELLGDETDPIPLATMNANAGSAWTLYTQNQLVLHSSVIVSSEARRELLLYYNLSYLPLPVYSRN